MQSSSSPISSRASAGNILNTYYWTAFLRDKIMSTEIESVELTKGGQPYKDNSTGRATWPVEKTPTLADMGITKDESVVLNKGSMGIGKSAVVWADRTPTLADMSTEQ